MKILNMIKNKRVIKNGVWMYLMQIFNTVIPLLTLPYITRILGSSQYGIFSIALNLLGYYQVVVEYGFGMSATRKVALSESGEFIINKLFSTVLLSRVVLFSFCCVATAVYFFLNKNLIECICLLVLMIGLIGNCIQLNWLFQGKQDMKFISIISIISRTLSVGLIFAFVKTTEQLLLYCLLYSVSPFINGILGLIIAKYKYNIKLVKVRTKDVITELKEGWYVFTTQLSSKVFGAIGITFLGVFASQSEVGIYSAINKLPNMIILAWTPITQVMYPISSKKMHESYKRGRAFIRKVQFIILPIAIFGATLISLFSKTIIMVAFGEEYVKYYYWVIPLLAWLVVAINNNFWGIQTLLGGGYDKEYSKCFQLSVAATVISNFCLIYIWKGNGACIAPLISEVILGMLLYREIRNINRINQ